MALVEILANGKEIRLPAHQDMMVTEVLLQTGEILTEGEILLRATDLAGAAKPEPAFEQDDQFKSKDPGKVEDIGQPDPTDHQNEKTVADGEAETEPEVTAGRARAAEPQTAASSDDKGTGKKSSKFGNWTVFLLVAAIAGGGLLSQTDIFQSGPSLTRKAVAYVDSLPDVITGAETFLASYQESGTAELAIVGLMRTYMEEKHKIKLDYVTRDIMQDPVYDKHGKLYAGKLRKGKKEGTGAELGEVLSYIGAYQDGSKHGWGQSVSTMGTAYLGQWKDGVASGKGAIIFRSDLEYVGDIKSGEPHGHGIMIDKDGYTKGSFKNGFPSGYAVRVGRDGAYYAGKFAIKEGSEFPFGASIPSGIGRFVAPNGDVYEGSFHGSYGNGEGKITFKKTGRVFHGRWKNFKPQ